MGIASNQFFRRAKNSDSVLFLTEIEPQLSEIESLLSENEFDDIDTECVLCGDILPEYSWNSHCDFCQKYKLWIPPTPHLLNSSEKEVLSSITLEKFVIFCFIVF